MPMARIPAAELWVQTQGPGLVRVTATPPARQSDLRQWVHEQTVASPKVLATGGLGLLAASVLGFLVLGPANVITVVALSSMATTGAGLAFLGLLKHKDRDAQPKALPPASSATVIAERARRVQAVLDEGDHTFEQLLGRLRWTESALLEALVAMKDAGQIIEDLDLDSGEWVYRSAFGGYGAAGALSLSERQARGPQ